MSLPETDECLFIDVWPRGQANQQQLTNDEQVDVEWPQVVGVENAILDLNADVDDAFLQQHGIQEDSATYFDAPSYAALRAELARLPSARFMAGGLTQNALRVVARLAPRAQYAAFVGFALGGDDAYAPRLCAELAADGVRARFAVDSSSVTTVVSSLVPPSRKRSLAFSSAAPSDAFAARFAAHMLDRDATSRRLVEHAAVVYSAGWMLVVSPALVVAAAQRLAAVDAQRHFAFNLAAETIVREPNLALLRQVLPHTSILFGNDHEFRALVVALGWFDDAALANPLSDDQASVVVVRVATLLRSGGRRIVAMTRSALPTAVYCSDAGAEAQLFDVLPVAKIVDTTGAGDAFVGGFLCALAQRRSLTDCIALGHFAAHRVVGVQGCNVAAAIRDLPDWYTPRAIPCRFRGVERRVAPFYWPGRADVWHRRLRSGVFGNFWSEVQPIEVRVGGRVGVFSTSEAAYQAMKWWFDDDVRRRFEATADGDAAFVLKLQVEAQRGIAATAWRRKVPLMLASDDELRAIADDGAVAVDEVTGWRAMELVLRAKFAQPALRQALLDSGDSFLLEHNPVRGRDLVWSDNFIGDGENQLGLMLMQLRELWRPGTFPSWAAGSEFAAFQAVACRACAAVEAFWRGYEIRDAAMDDAATPADAVAAARHAAVVVALDIAQLTAVADNDAALATCDISTAHLNRRDEWQLSLDGDVFQRCFAAVETGASGSVAVGGVAAPALCAAQRAGVECAFLGFALGGGDGAGGESERVVALMRAAGVRSRFVVDPSIRTTADVRVVVKPFGKPLHLVRRDGGAPSRAFAARFGGSVFDNDTESDRLLVGARVLLTTASYAVSVGSAAVLGAVERFYNAGGSERLAVLALDTASVLRVPSLATVFDVIQQAAVVVGTCAAFAQLGIESAWFEDLHEPLSDHDASAIAVRLAPRLRTDSRCIVVITRESRSTVVHADGALHVLEPIGTVAHSVFVGRLLAALALGATVEAAVTRAATAGQV